MSRTDADQNDVHPSEGALRHPTIYITAELALLFLLALLIYGLASLA